MSRNNLVGTTLGGRYRLTDRLGQGGMAAVYRADDPNLKRVVAVKVIHPHLSESAEFVRRFEEEAKAVAQLRHPNIVQVYDFNHDDELYYIVFEFVPGESLQDRMKRLAAAEREMSLQESVDVVATVADALAYAHKRNLVHRDVKPANVMLNVQGDPILMDFGIVKIAGGTQHTATGAVLGTARYMAPEQIRGERVDRRTDIYSLGAMLFELVGGRPPYDADSAMTVMMMHVSDPVPDLRRLRPDVPPGIVNIITRALAKRPEDRFQSADEMAAALRAADLSARFAPPVDATMVETPPVDATFVEAPPPVSPPAARPSPAQSPYTLEGAVPAGRSATAPPTTPPPATTAPPAGGGSRTPAIVGAIAALVLIIVLAFTVGPRLFGGGAEEAAAPDGGGEGAAVVAATEPVAADEPTPAPDPTDTPPPAATDTPAPDPTDTPAPTATPEPAPTEALLRPGVTADQSVVDTIESTGPVRLLTGDTSIDVVPGLPLLAGDTLAVDAGATLGLTFPSGTEIYALENTRFAFDGPYLSDVVLAEGSVLVMTPPGVDGVVNTPGGYPIVAFGSDAGASSMVLVEKGQFGFASEAGGYTVHCLATTCFNALPDTFGYGDKVVFAAADDGQVEAETLRTRATSAEPQVTAFDALCDCLAEPVAAFSDADQDGILDTADQCVAQYGAIAYYGCPPDTNYVQINRITLNNGTYIVEYETFGYTEVLPGNHVHFYFDTVPEEQAGLPGGGPWFVWGGPRPFNGYTEANRPAGATAMCARAANTDHSIILGSGNCVALP